MPGITYGVPGTPPDRKSALLPFYDPGSDGGAFGSGAEVVASCAAGCSSGTAGLIEALGACSEVGLGCSCLSNLLWAFLSLLAAYSP
jgi:hypothetical protein